jgi:hypothetical protein
MRHKITMLIAATFRVPEAASIKVGSGVQLCRYISTNAQEAMQRDAINEKL